MIFEEWEGRKGGREGKGEQDEEMEGNRNGCTDGGRKGHEPL